MQTQRNDSGSSQQAKPRRVKSNRYAGVYFRETPSGRRYEITYRDSTGRQRWKVVEGGEQEARDALNAVRGKLRRGERVAPTKQTFVQVAEAWLATQGELRPRTRESYLWAIEKHLAPRLGRLKVGQITEDHVAVLIAEMREGGYTGWTIHAVLTPLGRILGHAARRGLIGANPMDRLQRGERPSVGRRDMRTLSRVEIEALLGAADEAYRPMLATAVFTGLRLGELLGLTWANVDFAAGTLHVRRQLDRRGTRVEPKTRQAVRDVVLMPALSQMLKEHRLCTSYAGEDDFVFSSEAGSPLDHRNAVRRGFDRAVAAAELDGGDRVKLRFHDLRHCFASLLIAQGATVVFVSRQLGHASPNTTLNVYAHQFDAAEHAQRASDALEASFGAMLGNAAENTGGNARQANGTPAGAKVLSLAK